MTAFSPGLAQGCFELLSIVSRQCLTFEVVSRSFAYFGSVPCGGVLETVQKLDWAAADGSGHVVLTPRGERIAAAPSYEARLRAALLDYIEVVKPSWTQNAPFGRARVIAFSGPHIAQVFAEAGLATGTSDDVVEFWDLLAATARGQQTSSLNSIGRAGERLTLAYESNRTGRTPTWVAIDNNADGYDVLSHVSASDLRKLSIEVKTTSVGLPGHFHITRNEWERAVETECHVFHLWDVARRSTPRLAVLEVVELLLHMPTECGSGRWESVEVPFRCFQDRFVEA